jgi:uncharacterized protein YjdB
MAVSTILRSKHQKHLKKFILAFTLAGVSAWSGCAKTDSSSNPKGGGPSLQAIQITPGSPSVAAGLGAQLKASGQYSDNTSQDLTNSATWSSSNTNIATVSGTGMVSSIAMGSATIKATFSGVTGSVTLTVTAPNITSLSVTSPTASIAKGTTVQFKATGTFTDGTTQDATGLVQWSSSNPAVASINVNGAPGLAMGQAAGTSTITATSGSVSEGAPLTVTNATLVSVAVSPGSVTIPLGTVQQFDATGTFSDSTTQDITGSVTWSSSNISQISITVGGLATAKDLTPAGEPVTITAVSGSVQGTASATVNAADLKSLAITPANPTIAATTSQAFSATGTFNNGSTHNLTADVTWKSDTPSVATVASTGWAKGVSPGTANISATLGTVSDSTALTVTNATLATILVTPAGRTIAPGSEIEFTATGTFNDGSTQVINHDVTWASDNTHAATVGVGGVATAIAQGTANISASLEGITGSAPLTVSSVTLQSIALSPSTAVLAPASALLYSAVGTYSDGSTQTISDTVTWSSSDNSVASISGFGLATGQSAGTANITAQQGSVTSPAAAVVVESSPLASLAVTPSAAQVAEQTGIQFQAIGTFGDGSTQDLTASVLWTSSPASVATVGDSPSVKGFATGVAPGSATITALFAGEAGSATLTVTNATLISITITPSDSTVSPGTSLFFAAKGNFSDGTTENLTPEVNWKSSDVNVATISAIGQATAVSAGTTTITASMNGVSGQTTLTVQ